MKRTKFRLKRTKPVPAWNLTAAELRKFRASLPTAKPPPRGFAPRVPRETIFAWPSEAGFPLNAAWERGFAALATASTATMVRKHAERMSPTEWRNFIDAIETIAADGAAAPTYWDFVRVHADAFAAANMGWGVHSMAGMSGANFLAWHRAYIDALETRLQLVNPTVMLPYWEWGSARYRSLPGPMRTLPPVLEQAGVRRGEFRAGAIPQPAQVNAVLGNENFGAFQAALERAHNGPHNIFGPRTTFGSEASPADPIFWLHHAYIDKLWADWQSDPNRAGADGRPSNPGAALDPPPIMTLRVEQVLATTDLGYVYGPPPGEA